MIQSKHAGNRRGRGGFTLVELLIVVIILAILAAIVVPQFIGATDDARLASADTTLTNMRASIDLYYNQHAEYPSALADGGAGLINTSAAFISQLSQYTTADGDVALTKDATHIYGPYLRKAQIPTDPMTQSAALKIETAGALGLVAEAGDPGGYRFDNLTGQFLINHATWDDR